LQAAQKRPQRRNPRDRVRENVIENSERARTRNTNTNSSEAIERNEAYESFSAAC
jgi:hypothetical protein